MPIWAFHGEADDVVAPAETEQMIAAVRAAGGEPRFTLYAGVGHNAWDRAYRTEPLPAWLMAQRRSVPGSDVRF